jgi:hypothetical protein
MSRRRKRQTELVELTSKPLKLQSALSGLLLFVGIILVIGKSPFGFPIALLGFVWHSITRIRIWWNHG